MIKCVIIHRLLSVSLIRGGLRAKLAYAAETGASVQYLTGSRSLDSETLANLNSWVRFKQHENGEDYYMREAIEVGFHNSEPVWIVLDCRSAADLTAFSSDPRFASATMITVRINADESIRASRGFIYTIGK